MILEEVLAGGGVLIVLMALIEISPVKINPWGAVFGLVRKSLGHIGGRINADVIAELQSMKATQEEVRGKLDSHIESDERKEADGVRAQILRFNNELLRDIHHTKEEYIDILAGIDAYEAYCERHPDYPNNRAVLAVETIKESYKERLQKRDFLESVGSVS